mgnify:CR=1 FL=1
MWTQQQIDRALELEAQGAIIAFYCSDRNGLPANGGAATEKYMMVPGQFTRLMGHWNYALLEPFMRLCNHIDGLGHVFG